MYVRVGPVHLPALPSASIARPMVSHFISSSSFKMTDLIWFSLHAGALQHRLDIACGVFFRMVCSYWQLHPSLSLHISAPGLTTDHYGVYARKLKGNRFGYRAVLFAAACIFPPGSSRFSRISSALVVPCVRQLELKRESEARNAERGGGCIMFLLLFSGGFPFVPPEFYGDEKSLLR